MIIISDFITIRNNKKLKSLVSSRGCTLSRDEPALSVEAGQQQQAFLERLLTHFGLLYYDFRLETLKIKELSRKVYDYSGEMYLFEAVEQLEIKYR